MSIVCALDASVKAQPPRRRRSAERKKRTDSLHMAGVYSHYCQTGSCTPRRAQPRFRHRGSHCEEHGPRSCPSSDYRRPPIQCQVDLYANLRFIHKRMMCTSHNTVSVRWCALWLRSLTHTSGPIASSGGFCTRGPCCFRASTSARDRHRHALQRHQPPKPRIFPQCCRSRSIGCPCHHMHARCSSQYGCG